MNVRNVNEKPEKKGDAREGTEEKGGKTDAAKKFGKYFAAGAALVAALALPACMNRAGEKGIDLDGLTADTQNENRLDGTGDGLEDMEEVSDVPEEAEDVTDVEEDVVEDIASDVEEDVSEDVESEDAESEDVTEEDVVSEDVVGDTSTDTVDEDVTDVSGEEMGGTCSPIDDLQTRWINNDGSAIVVGNVGFKYKGTDTSGNAVYDILCEDVVVRSDIATPLYTDVTVNVSEHAFSVTLRTNLADSTRCNVRIDVDAY